MLLAAKKVTVPCQVSMKGERDDVGIFTSCRCLWSLPTQTLLRYLAFGQKVEERTAGLHLSGYKPLGGLGSNPRAASILPLSATRAPARWQAGCALTHRTCLSLSHKGNIVVRISYCGSVLHVAPGSEVRLTSCSYLSCA